MADMSDSPNQSAPAGTNQRTPSSAHNKRRTRKNNPQMDGAVSDGAVAHPASPRSKKAQAQAHKQRQSVAGTRAAPIQQNGNMGNVNGQKPRPVSVGGNQIHATPAKEQAYAASAFQASPAPSSLPMPKFLSRSVPNAGIPPTLQERHAGETTSDGQSSSPGSDNASPVPPPREAQQSPLDIFFKAARADEERRRNGSTSMSPELGARPPPPSAHVNPFQYSGKSIFMQELDGDDDNMPSPRTIPPTNRPPNNRLYSSPAAPPRPVGTEQERAAQSKALKDQLLGMVGTPPREPSRGSSGSQTPEGVFGSPSPFQRPVSSGPSTPQPSSDQQQSQYSLHYNNRMNLSPLFQKARAETPPRQSGLRQEVPSDVVSNADSAVDMQTNYPHPPSVDTQAFARSYLKEQIRTSGPAQMPQLHWNSGPPPVRNPGNIHSPEPVPIPVQPVHAQHGVPSSTTPRSDGSKDMKGMEDDLRRMLKINNVLG